ncbi:NprX family peptide pheromone [Bacillus sp. DX4.1]|nr:NprX family peptide pheromone [Bacillus sp. DX4.1]MDM5187078.1 NprX family peptide pheromone [Bacillus sp. DX4.1]
MKKVLDGLLMIGLLFTAMGGIQQYTSKPDIY